MSPSVKARIAGAFYLLVFVTGTLALISDSGKLVGNVAASACYAVVTVLFYGLFKPVNRNVSLIAAVFSFAGCVLGVLNTFHLPPPINSLVLFGFYCLLIGYLIFRSMFLPRILGVLMALGGLGWLTFAYPPLAHKLSPYNFAPGMVGEGALTLWLLIAGVNAQTWKQRSASAGSSTG